MLSAIFEAVLGCALILFVILHYVTIPSLLPAKRTWIWLEAHFEFTKKWWFNVVVVLLSAAMIGQVPDQLEASKYGIDRDKLSAFRAEAARHHLTLAEYKNETHKSEALNFKNVDDYLKAKELGFEDSGSWENAQKLHVGSLADYKSQLETMKSRGIADVDQYVVLLDKESRERDAQEKAKEAAKEAAEHALENSKNASNPEYLFNKFSVEATFKCKKPIESSAKNNFEWFDSAFERKFDSYITKTPSPGVFIMVGDKIKFQNGFGAWKIMEYKCTYDSVAGKVLDVEVYDKN